MATKPSTQATGRATKALKEQSKVRRQLLGKAKSKADQLEASENSSWKYKDKKTGKVHGWQAETVYTAGRPGDNQRSADKYVSTKRRTTSKMKKKD